MAKVDQIHPDVKKNYNCNQCGYSSTKLSYLKTHMWVHSGENRLFVHNSTTLAIKLVGLESTCESDPEKSLIVTNSANIPPQGNIFSKSTCSLVQGREALCLQSVQLLLQAAKRTEISHAFPHWWETLCLQEMRILMQAVPWFQNWQSWLFLENLKSWRWMSVSYLDSIRNSCNAFNPSLIQNHVGTFGWHFSSLDFHLCY